MKRSMNWKIEVNFIGFLIILSLITFIYSSEDIQDIGGPIIIPSVAEVILNKGQNFTIHCQSNNPIEIKQQEIPEDPPNVDVFDKVLKNVTSTDPNYKFEIAYNLYNVNEFAVGYYACYDNTINSNDILLNVMDEPTKTTHISYIYVYVNGTNSLLAPMREIVRLRNGSKVLIECRPTTPDVNVTLLGDFPDSEYHQNFNPKIGFTFESDYFEVPLAIITCSFERQGISGQKYVLVNQHINVEPPTPNITSDTKYFIEGETFTINCTVTYQTNSAVVLTWDVPAQSWNRILNDTNEHDATGGIIYNAITIVNATEADAGNYICLCKNTNGRSRAKYTKIYKGIKGFVRLIRSRSRLIETKQKSIRISTDIDDHPTAKVVLLKNNEPLQVNDTSKYQINYNLHDSIALKINNLNINDTGNYTVVASNEFEESNVTYDLRPHAAPTVNIVPSDDIKCLLGFKTSLTCEAIGYPLPNLKWIFLDHKGEKQSIMGKTRVQSIIKVRSILEIPVNASGNITCYAENQLGRANSTRKVIIYEVPQGFGLKSGETTWFPEGQAVKLACYASKEDFRNVTWLRNENDTDFNKVRISETQFSYIALMEMGKVKLADAGEYKCFGLRKDNATELETVAITVAERRAPNITEPIKNTDIEVNPYQPVRLSCQATAVPPPKIVWRKDGEELINSSDVEIITEYIDTFQTLVNTTVDIRRMLEDFSGKYECLAVSEGLSEKRVYTVAIVDKLNRTAYLSITGVVVFVLILLIVYLAWKIRKEKQFRKQLAAAGLLYFKEGVPKSLNPDLGIDEQAELLPYDDKFEFPPHKLIIGKQLGAGAFGVVYKADARGIINAEEVTPVAVKMVKKTADNMYIRALASELKIMVHLGKHINIVNLLGACTKNVGKRELLVIVEYCKFGNIHNYMQRHREVFIDQLTDNKDKNSGKVNKGFSCSSGSSGLHSDYLGSNHSQETENTFVNTVNTQYVRRSGRKVSETGYIQPEWRSNYESDYSFDGRNPRPLTSRDLLAWAFQIARGMEYLASRKVLHGDLAARNVLLAEDNIVKICDFGLARSIYKNDEYKKQENSPLPIKWLAIECMTDRIFSTQSDVWSFGVVLWELFSLAKTPYPNVSPASFIDWLNDGHRLEKPQYADDRLYDVMLRCWEQKPTARPNFSQLQEILGSFLEENVRNHYVDLNAVYMDLNVKQESGNDYLAMVCAPDYNNLVTPSPHHYTNDSASFFPLTPTQLQHDDEGYLQMSPATKQSLFNPRGSNNKFDFDSRKMNTKMTEPNSQGSELTPMLTLNNLPSRGSESDHDGNSLPYLNMCPRIDEETDDVFEMKQYNFDNAQDSQNSAVTNPTYITFDGKKKPYNISNNYININVPNGLVK